MFRVMYYYSGYIIIICINIYIYIYIYTREEKYEREKTVMKKRINLRIEDKRVRIKNIILYIYIL